jgi:hypothetical protein
MPSRILADRTHLDKQVLAGCPENQAIPLDKLHLAPRVGNKIFRPQKAAYMINNLPISESEKESFLLDFVERSIKSRPILPQAVQYNSRSLDHVGPLVTQNESRPTTPAFSVDDLTSRAPSPSSQPEDPMQDMPEELGDRAQLNLAREGRNILFEEVGNPRTNAQEPSSSNSNIQGLPVGSFDDNVNSPFVLTTPARVAGTGSAAASQIRSTHHYSDRIYSQGTSSNLASPFRAGALVDRPGDSPVASHTRLQDSTRSGMQGNPTRHNRGRIQVLPQ